MTSANAAAMLDQLAGERPPSEQVRLSAEAVDWLREIRARHRIPATAILEGLVELAQGEPELLARAAAAGLDRAKERRATR